MNNIEPDTPPELEEVPDLLEVDDEPQAGPSSASYDRPKVPITLLTGYLGAGKSTLLEYIMTANHGYRIAVCMNDFGDTTDIEAKSLNFSDGTTNSQSSSMLSLPNGCLCCSFKDMGIAAIEEMVAAQKEQIDWVLVELTGVADPGPIAKSFWGNEEMGDLILDGIVCVVDCRNILKQLSEERSEGEINEAQKQLAASDVIILNKLDLVSTDQVAEVERVVGGLNPTLRVHKTTKSQIDLKELFDLRAYTAAPPTPTVAESSAACDHHHNHGHDHDHESVGVHNSGITTILIPLPQLSHGQYEKLRDFLEILLWKTIVPNAKKYTPEILRCKGLIRLEGGKELVLQGVTDIFEMKELTEATAGKGEREQAGKVVFIGRRVDERLRTALREYIGVEGQ